MLHFLHHHLLILAMLASTGALAVALMAQYVFGLEPCQLCSYQRIPYASVLLFGGVALLIGEWNKPNVGYLLGVIFLTGAVLAIYHSGVEWHWWSSANSCGGFQRLPNNITELTKGLSEAVLKACDEIDWTLFGLSMTVYNAAVSLMLASACFLIVRKTQ